MCSILVLRRPGHPWPVVVAANRDEMADRAWREPARHWPDRPEVVAGLDEVARGSWLGLNDYGVIAAILNRVGTLGPMEGKRSRGELVLDALDHADAALAAEALRDLDPHAYRPFNMIVVDNRDGFWIRNFGDDRPVSVLALGDGLSMLTAFERNDATDPRIRRYLPLFRQAAPPDPDQDQWAEWEGLLAARHYDDGSDATGAMCFHLTSGFGTSSASLMALPAVNAAGRRPVWRFAAGSPDVTPFRRVKGD
ncbi:MAG: NRDE family protein [Alphaproteobacteria bacterium]